MNSMRIRTNLISIARVPVFAVALLYVLATVSLAETPLPVIPTDGSVTAEQLDTAIKAIESRESLDDATRKQILDQLRDAQAQLQNRQAADAAADAFTAAIQTAPDETASLRRQLDAPVGAPPTLRSLGIAPTATLPDLEQALSAKLAELASAQARLADLEAQVTAMADRPAKARERINALRDRLDQLLAATTAAPPPGEAGDLSNARRLATELKVAAAKAELNRLDQELLSHGARSELAKAQRDVAARKLANLRREVDVLQSAVNAKRQSAVALAQQETALAELAAADKHPVVRALAEGNAELTHELPTVAADIERVTGQLAGIEEQARQIEQSLVRSRQRLEIGGVSQVIGSLFVEERRNLPQVSQYRAEVRERRHTLANIGLAQVRIEEQRRELTPIEDRIDQAMAQVAADVTDDGELQNIRQEVELLLRNRRDLLDQVTNTYTSYLRALGDLDIAQQRLLDAAAEYEQFLDQHLLWIPSASPFWLKDLRSLAPAASWVLAPRSWLETLKSLTQAFEFSPFSSIALLLLLGAVFFSRRPLGRLFRQINSKVGRLSTDSIGLTLGATCIAAVRALPLPLLLAVLSWALTRSPEHSDFTAAVARGFVVLGPFLYNTTLFRVLCARDGVMQIHFGWSPDRLAVIRKQLDRLVAVAAPIIFVAVLAYNSPIPAYREGLGRLAFVVTMIIFSGVNDALLHPVRGVAARTYSARPTHWVSRLRWLWYVAGAGSPVLLALGAMVGYLYTAGILTGRLVDTFWLVLGILIVNLVVTRWLVLTKRKIAWQRLLEQRRARKAAGNEDADTDAESAGVERQPLDLDAVDLQTRRLVNAGLFFVGTLAAWGIWSEILPALGVLDQVSLWSRTVMVDGNETIGSVTLADLLLALVVVGVTAIASANLPGLMEIVVIQRLTLKPGSRYAINTLVRYVVITVGTVVVLNIVGWNWSQIQWLVAALSVGLGFGLQEIVANFVSGLVILFERPVRVGDTVTVGELTGTVSRVRIRATTITDWDRKEIIVPNKSFITEQVINWTLSDPITRIVIPVGIAYGSDVKLAHEVMEKTLNSMPIVLDEPPPRVYFVGLGDSSLNFNLYVYSRELSDRLPLTHAVHQEILSALRQHDIEIPFPQRDLHLRSVDKDIRGFGRQPKESNDRDD